MSHKCHFSADHNARSSYVSPRDPKVSKSSQKDLYSGVGLLIENPYAFQEALNRFCKAAGVFLQWFASGSNFDRSSCADKVKQSISYSHNFTGLHFRSSSKSNVECSRMVFFYKIAQLTMKKLWKEIEQLQSLSMLSLASAFVLPFDYLLMEDSSTKVLAAPQRNIDVRSDQLRCACGNRRPAGPLSPKIYSTGQVTESTTGITFPAVLDNISDSENNSSFPSEVLVGTGFKGMKVIKIKSLNVYAFGLYVQPDSICERLGPKYASVPINELNNRPDFYDDLLRQDIHMSIKLVVNCNGLKINSVRDAFEKSLRARLFKINPKTDYYCLRTFGSYFAQDIPLPMGTAIYFRQTADGKLITEVNGKQIGTVHSKELCKAFFDMYIGDGPVSIQAKEEIAKNVAGIIRRC